MIEYVQNKQYLDLLDVLAPIFYFLLALAAIFIIYIWIKLERSQDFTIIHHNFQKNAKSDQINKI